MGLVIPSSEEKLRLSGVPIGVMAQGSDGFDLELQKPDPDNEKDMATQKALEAAGMNHYKIVDCRHEPNPMTPYN